MDRCSWNSVGPVRAVGGRSFSSVRMMAPFGKRGAFGYTVFGEFREFGAHFVEGQTHALRENDEGDPAEDCTGIAAVPGACAFGFDEPAVFIEPQGRGCYAAAFGDFRDCEEAGQI